MIQTSISWVPIGFLEATGRLSPDVVLHSRDIANRKANHILIQAAISLEGKLYSTLSLYKNVSKPKAYRGLHIE